MPTMTPDSLNDDPQTVDTSGRTVPVGWIPFIPVGLAVGLIIAALLIFWSFAPAFH